MARLLLAIFLFYNAAVFVYFRLLRMQKNVIPFFWFSFFFKFTFHTIFKFDLTFFCLGFCSGWWRSLWKRLTFNRNLWVCVSELFVLFVNVCVSCCLDIQEKFMNEFFLLNKRWKKEFEFITFFSIPLLIGRQIIMEMFFSVFRSLYWSKSQILQVSLCYRCRCLSCFLLHSLCTV